MPNGIVHHPDFHVHGLAVRWPDGLLEFRTDVTEVLAEARRRYGQNLEQVIVAGHNLLFDAYILAKKYDLRPTHLLDTLQMARHVHPGGDNDLAHLAKRYGLEPKGDALATLEGVRDLSSEQLAALAEYSCHDAHLTWRLAQKLLPQVSRPQVELPLMDHTLRLFTERGLQFDIAGGEQLLVEMKWDVENALLKAGIDRKTAGGSKLVDLLEAEGCEIQTKRGKRSVIPALAKTDDFMMNLLVHPNARIRSLATARIAVKGAPAREKRIETMIAIARATGGLMPVPLCYCGAHTGRFSGMDRINLQNLSARSEGPAQKIRGLLHARNGYRLVVADASQIEARILAWLAGQADLVAAFATGDDVYSQFAGKIFGETVRKPHDGDSPEQAGRFKSRRQLGKLAILGLGYNMGHERFGQLVRQTPELAAMRDAGMLPQSFISSVVDAYRRKYHCIPVLWREVGKAFRRAYDGGKGVAGRTEFYRIGNDIHACLPSSRVVRYRQVHWEDGQLCHGRGDKVYGGKLVENLVQAMARDVLAEAILRLEQEGYRVVHHVHDEIVVEVPYEQADAALKAAIRALSTTPAWAAGLPLAAEGYVADRYGKQ